MKSDILQVDYKAIHEIIEPGATVLDLGCGEGDLLALLVKENKVKGQGIEIDDDCVYKCVEKGVSVYHGDLDTGLADYQDKSFDYVILNQTMQQLRKPDTVIKEALRVGKRVIVGFPNFCYLTSRIQIFFHGRVPVTPALPYDWYDTPNLHFLSIKDFEVYCSRRGVRVEKTIFLSKKTVINFLPNLMARNAVFVISK